MSSTQPSQVSPARPTHHGRPVPVDHLALRLRKERDGILASLLAARQPQHALVADDGRHDHEHGDLGLQAKKTSQQVGQARTNVG